MSLKDEGVRIVYPGDSDWLDLQDIRNTMPEPGRYKDRTITCAVFPKIPLWEQMSMSFQYSEPEREEWEKVLLDYKTTKFWAWKNIKHNIIVI